jgi:hypothetical protein
MRLTRLQRDLLWILEEAGEETLSTILGTLNSPDRKSFDRDLAALVRLNFVYVREQGGDSSVVLTSSGRQALTT